MTVEIKSTRSRASNSGYNSGYNSDCNSGSSERGRARTLDPVISTWYSVLDNLVQCFGQRNWKELSDSAILVNLIFLVTNFDNQLCGNW